MSIPTNYHGSVANYLLDEAYHNGRKLTKDQKKIILKIEKLENGPSGNKLWHIYNAINEAPKIDEKIAKLVRQFKMLGV